MTAASDASRIALDLQGFDIGRDEVRIVRRCARCRRARFCLGHVGGVAHRIQCGTCGHEWIGRVTQREEQ